MSEYDLPNAADFVTGVKSVDGREYVFYVDDFVFYYLACIQDARYRNRMHAEVLRTNRLDNRSEITTRL